MADHQRLHEHESLQSNCDVAIIGGGMAGLTLAWQLKQTRPGLRMLVIEKQAHPVPEAAHKVGESTVEIAAHYLRDVLGLAEHLQTQQLPKFGLRIFASFHDNSDITQRVELGHAVPPPRGVGTYQLDRGRLENALGGQLAQKDIGFLDDCKVQQIVLQPQDECHCLHVLREGKLHKIQARWIVDASGRSAVLKRQLGLAKQVGHHANAVWFRIAHPIDINTWSTDPDWHARIREGERSLSTNHLMGTGYWVWLIRLASDSTSIGIVADANVYPFEHMNRFDRALAWLQQHEPQCAAIVEHHRDQVQDFRVMKDYAYSCEQVYSQDRWCLTGEAGVSLDPLYSPGGDLIAISNGLICDLITRDIAGEDIEERAAIHNQFFLILVNSWLGIYEQQYALMDNARIMVAKVIWDTAVYWAIPGLLYFHDKFRDFVDSPGMVMNLLRFSLLSDHVQAFFRAWHTIDHSVAHDTSIRYYDFDFMEQLHIGMRAGLDDGALEQQFATNVRFLEQLAGQLVSVVIDICEEQSNQPEVHHCIERWRTDPFLAELMTIYQQDRDIHPIDAGWITLGESLRNQEELVR